ncbi:MAG: hypothetical protein GFH24_608378n15 [Chloroflexi bacterium AL-N5]|nr:hypothetical protein [Chloroflexi bacterium AL-N5]
MLSEVELVYCLGMTNWQVNQYLQTVLQTLNKRYGMREIDRILCG